MTWIIFAAAVLAVYCVSLFVSKLSGPGGIFTKLRGAAKGSVKEGISCPYCASTWIAAAMLAFLCWRGHSVWLDFPLYLFAITGGSVVLHVWLPPAK